MIVYTILSGQPLLFFYLFVWAVSVACAYSGVRNLFYAWIALYDISILLYRVAVFVYSLYLI